MPGTRTKSAFEMAWMLAVEMWPEALNASSEAKAVTASRRPEKQINRNIRLARIETFLIGGEAHELCPMERPTQFGIRMSRPKSATQ
ncbi:hypothetical protein NITLEN_40351 [Nitrospira lenta]|uniref:Uncharacterized protein n=1 Tax=Nitrospira lenta TaxID=1436998 RepID=A0A330LFR7_9BACT|nr:hypothetical protein NITLEN_40351 [Nitrospira lenta]